MNVSLKLKYCGFIVTSLATLLPVIMNAESSFSPAVTQEQILMLNNDRASIERTALENFGLTSDRSGR